MRRVIHGMMPHEVAVASSASSTRLTEATVWSNVEPLLLNFKASVRAVDRDALARGSISSASELETLRAFTELELATKNLLNAPNGESVGNRLQAELLPYLLMSENAERWYAKPRGYAGDFLSIARMYEDQPRGLGRVGRVLDRCFLSMAAVRAVQNRRRLLAREIQSTVASTAPERARVTSLACGPARELFDVYEELPDPRLLSTTLLDLDLQALAYVAELRDCAKLKHQMLLLNDNLVQLAAGRGRSNIKDQHLVYSVGLIDYFKDELVVRLMNFVHSILAPGGRVIFGNFHPRNPTRGIMDHVLEWKLIHRTEEMMNRLFLASKFARPCTRIIYEEQEINLFAECVKA